MRVRKIIDINRLSEILVKNGTSIIVPVTDGAGNLIIGNEVLQDSAFESIHELLKAITEEIEYVPFTEKTIDAVATKLIQFKSEGKVVVIEEGKDTVDFNGVKIAIRDINTKNPPKEEEPDIPKDVDVSIK